MNSTKHPHRMLTLIAALACCGMLMAAPGTAQAQNIITDASAQPRTLEPEPERGFTRPIIGLGARFMWFWDADRSRDPFYDTDGHSNTGLFLEVQPVEHIVPGDRLLVGAEWLSGNNNGTELYGISTDLDEQHFMATVDYGYELTPWLTPYARFGVGMSFYDLAVGELSAEDDWLLTGYGSLGLEVVLRWAVQLGARFEYGHTLRTEPSFTLGGRRNTPEEEVTMPTTGTELGTMSVNGQTFTLSFFARL